MIYESFFAMTERRHVPKVLGGMGKQKVQMVEQCKLGACVKMVYAIIISISKLIHTTYTGGVKRFSVGLQTRTGP